jgi:5-formyltetrahydrofolate cyclo-ligase
VSADRPTDGPEPQPDLRTSCRAARRAVPPDQRIAAARQVAERVRTLALDRVPGRVATYLPEDGELDPTLSVHVLRAAGWQAHLPVVGAVGSMRFAPWGPDTRLTPNRFGIDEPEDVSTLLTARELDLVLVPCVAIDPAGNRLGFGKGFYDRALADAEDPGMLSSGPRPLLVAVAFDVQVVPAVHHEPWDVMLDVVVSESATIITGARPWPAQR